MVYPEHPEPTPNTLPSTREGCALCLSLCSLRLAAVLVEMETRGMRVEAWSTMGTVLAAIKKLIKRTKA